MTDSASLEQLLSACAEGDTDALKQLYDATAPQLFGVAVRILNDRGLAEEVVQDAYVQVWNRAAAFAQRRGSAKAWLLSIVRYRAIDVLRRRRFERPDATPRDPEIADGAPDPLALLSTAQDAGRISVCLEELNTETRQAIALAYYDGCTQDEIAARTESPLGTVKSRIRRGLMALKDCLTR